MNTAVLFIIFNRADLACAVFEKIREAQPKRLYIAADGPRKDRTDEPEKCELTRKSILDMIDWDCELKCKFEDQNLGCKIAVSSAIDWFFSLEEEGIILEDDCLPDATFFRFCEEMLSLYRANETVRMITGTNFRPSEAAANTYSFSSCFSIWGWATWRRAWSSYDVQMKTWKQNLENGSFKRLFEDRRIFYYWHDMFDKVHGGKIDTWDYQWVYSCLIAKGFSVIPSANLISNLGFREDATHTRNESNACALIKTTELMFPLKHPDKVEKSINMDDFIYREIFKVFKKYSYHKRLERYLRKLIGNLFAALKSGEN